MPTRATTTSSSIRSAPIRRVSWTSTRARFFPDSRSAARRRPDLVARRMRSPRREEDDAMPESRVVERWEIVNWPGNWSAVWVGALAALAVGLIVGRVGTAVGAYQEMDIVRWRKVQLGSAVFRVCGAFFAFAVGGWVAGKIRGARHAETSMLHGAIAWLVTVPMFLVLAALGSMGSFGVWYGGLAGTPAWVTPVVADPQTALRLAEHGALGAVAALLLGLVGSVVGGWLASGEPMTITYYRTRTAFAGGSK